MKKLLPLFVLALALASCQKENTQEEMAMAETQQTLSLSDYVGTEIFVLGPSEDGTQPFRTVKLTAEMLEQIQSSDELEMRNGNGNSHSHGYFEQNNPNPFIIQRRIDYNATQNSQGGSGNMSIVIDYAEVPAFGTGPGTYSLELEPECILTSGNDAVISGIVVSVQGDVPAWAGENVGDKYFIKVQDNGQGANAPADRVNTEIFFVPSTLPFPCELIGPDAFLWMVIGQMVDVSNPPRENIKVNN
ncbi:MAG: hypothetical protein H6559_01070 [Lewinellaceae bacterium]|nr:hypothetical protein [Lewinellaceae bacterium]